MKIQQSTTAYALVFLMVDSSDHVTGKTGLSPTVTLSKNGGSFASPSGAVTEIGSGWYKVAGNATDSGTLGALALHATSAGADPTDMLFEVVVDDLTTVGLRPTTAGRTLDVSATGEAGMDWGNIGSPTTTVDLSGTSIKQLDSAGQTAILTALFADIRSGLIRSAAAQSGGSTSTIKLDASASAIDNYYSGCLVMVNIAAIGGVSAIGFGICSSYNGTTKVLTIDGTWTNGGSPTTSDTFYIFAAGSGNLTSTLATAVRTEMDSNSTQLAKLGTPAGVSVSADIASVKTDTGTTIPGRLPAALVSGRMDASVGAYQSGQAPLQPTTAGRTLDVSATGEAGIDMANVGSPTTTVNLSGTTVGTVTTLTGNTPQTGDAYARLGAPAGASHAADVAAVKTDTGNLLSRLGAWAGSGVNTVLGAFKALLSKTASTPSDIGGTFDPTTDSTEAIRDRGDAAYLTASGFATSSALSTAQTDLTTLTGRLTSGRASNLDNLNALISSRAAAGDAMALTSGERATLAAAILDLTDAIEAGLTPRQAMRLIASAIGGKLSGGGTGTEVFRNAVADTKDRITATVDDDGNRTVIALDLT